MGLDDLLGSVSWVVFCEVRERIVSDKELLELAAKAAGIWDDSDPSSGLLKGTGQYWNPLTDDADALRLAVKLDIDLEMVPFGGRAIVRDDDDCGEYFDVEGDDKYAATRRAIVRAAAGIGKEVE